MNTVAKLAAHIKEAVKVMTDMKLTLITKKCKSALSEMEKLFTLIICTELYVWLIFSLHKGHVVDSKRWLEMEILGRRDICKEQLI